MEYSLKHDERIRLYLKVFIPIPEICNHIIKIKNTEEDKETYHYHLHRWNMIAGEHFLARDTHTDKFSYVYNDLYSSEYIIKIDHRLEFYYLTGISYQVVELLHTLIKMKNCPYLEEDYEYTFASDDKLYSELSSRIMGHMKNI